MRAFLRILVFTLAVVLLLVLGCSYCLISPRNPKHVYNFGRLFSLTSYIFGIRLELRLPQKGKEKGQSVFISNHQNNWDMMTLSGAVTPKVVTVGKKSLLWLPLFGQLYWLTGNILIDRSNKIRARETIDHVVRKIKKSDISVWIFPEGTRSRGSGLLKFKKGAFYAAIKAGVPITPIVCSSTKKLKVNRRNNGVVIVEMLPAISTEGYKTRNVAELTSLCYSVMKEKLDQLDLEVEKRNKSLGC